MLKYQGKKLTHGYHLTLKKIGKALELGAGTQFLNLINCFLDAVASKLLWKGTL